MRLRTLVDLEGLVGERDRCRVRHREADVRRAVRGEGVEDRRIALEHLRQPGVVGVVADDEDLVHTAVRELEGGAGVGTRTADAGELLADESVRVNADPRSHVESEGPVALRRLVLDLRRRGGLERFLRATLP